MFNPILLLASLSLLRSAAAAPRIVPAAPTATIADGVIVGVPTSVPGGQVAVNKYLGIPFAQSPPQRFSPPTNPTPWTTPLQATAFKPACIQQFNQPNNSRSETMRIFNSPGNTPPEESEDCLYLNVYTPKSASAHEAQEGNGLPVMFWIYGGNLQFGTAGISFYDGSSFAANQNVVVVTTNYRTNAFGFSASPQIPAGQQNSGFLDQRKALAWVQANIASFGGDPTKVTIFGESAGGYSVKQLVATPPEPVPFRAAILESEAATIPASPLASWDQLVLLTNCAAAPSQIDCVRAVPAAQIKSIIEQYMIGFGPVEDGTTYVKDTRTAFTTHTAAQIPLFFGTNSQEGRVFAYLFGLNANYTAQQYLEQTFPGATALQAAIFAAYPPALQNQPYEFASQVITDLIFTCTTSALSTLTAANGYPTWRYFFNQTFPNTQIFPDAGVYHSSEIPEVFGTYPTANVTAFEVNLSKYMQTAWANFAKNPIGGPGWPRLGTNFGIELGDLIGNGEQTIPLASVDYICALYAPIIAAQGL